MAFNPIECWDCPVTLLPLILLLLIAFAILGAGVGAVSRNGPARVMGGVLLAAAGILYVGGTAVIVRLGVIWNSTWNRELTPDGWRTSRAADIALLASWYLLSALLIRKRLWRARAVA